MGLDNKKGGIPREWLVASSMLGAASTLTIQTIAKQYIAPEYFCSLLFFSILLMVLPIIYSLRKKKLQFFLSILIAVFIFYLITPCSCFNTEFSTPEDIDVSDEEIPDDNSIDDENIYKEPELKYAYILIGTFDSLQDVWVAKMVDNLGDDLKSLESLENSEVNIAGISKAFPLIKNKSSDFFTQNSIKTFYINDKVNLLNIKKAFTDADGLTYYVSKIELTIN